LRSSRAQVWFSATTGQEKCHPHQPARAIRRDSSAIGSNEKLENDDYQQREKKHGVDGVFRSHSRRRSLSTSLRVHPDASDGLRDAIGDELLIVLLLRQLAVGFVICPASMQMNSSATPSSGILVGGPRKLSFPR